MARELAPIIWHLIKTFPNWFWYTSPVVEYEPVMPTYKPPRKPKMKPIGEPINLRQWVGRRSYVAGGYIYILKDIEISGYYKIGKTRVPYDRMKAFGVRLPFETDLIHVIECYNADRVETQLHRKFADKRKRGEWFALTDEDIKWLKLHHQITAA